jgi:hypothetical protein
MAYCYKFDWLEIFLFHKLQNKKIKRGGLHDWKFFSFDWLIQELRLITIRSSEFKNEAKRRIKHCVLYFVY